jgi:hypothetical protein
MAPYSPPISHYAHIKLPSDSSHAAMRYLMGINGRKLYKWTLNFGLKYMWLDVEEKRMEIWASEFVLNKNIRTLEQKILKQLEIHSTLHYAHIKLPSDTSIGAMRYLMGTNRNNLCNWTKHFGLIKFLWLDLKEKNLEICATRKFKRKEIRKLEQKILQKQNDYSTLNDFVVCDVEQTLRKS